MLGVISGAAGSLQRQKEIQVRQARGVENIGVLLQKIHNLDHT